MLAYLDESYSLDWYCVAAMLRDGPGVKAIASALDAVVVKAAKRIPWPGPEHTTAPLAAGPKAGSETSRFLHTRFVATTEDANAVRAGLSSGGWWRASRIPKAGGFEDDRTVGALVFVLGVWAVSGVVFLRIGDQGGRGRERDWRFVPVLAVGFAVPLGAAYGLADWSGFTSLLVAGVAAFAVLSWLFRPARA
ncbi:hypothetical protein [Actinoplanes regularis]|uniref:Uncharacterized protein n=1 Tax=Actinoplanes regularis TaxID=52697 RepID=A0A238W6Z3_9ACTN|nr:hypothetical protein [Actinoplanes regularis]GIE85204.1 hypothetical protein Are01nite_16840 [Actinoplanes regularis]SNR42312.1 hypothetical protein SAMN06264365_102223 [Actinoplanes regularis]